MDKLIFDEVEEVLWSLCGYMSRVLDLSNAARAIEITLDKKNDPLLVMVMDEFPTGKSTFINALMKKILSKLELLPLLQL